MYRTTLPTIGTANAWRDAARQYLSAGIPPEQILWNDQHAAPDLFAAGDMQPQNSTATVPKSFISMAHTVSWHSDPERFARLYAFLWRLRKTPSLMSDRGDADLARLRLMEKNVHRCQHKMKAFVRFREITQSGANRRSFAAWFEPTHHTIEPTADFFVRRFSDMDWRILTPEVSAIFDGDGLRFETGHTKPDLPDDASEQLWITYFQNIFNPARLKVKAMQSEMPKKYWKNMPEAAYIPAMIASATARAQAMADAAPTLPPLRMGRVQAQLSDCTSAWDGPQGTLPAAISACTRCPLHRNATQAVPGQGPQNANLMIVGEQPGDIEDLAGKPFIGPAGQLFDTLAGEVGLDRKGAYITNAVKHFKFTPKGRKRLHQRPNTSEIEHCRWWLDAEITAVKPTLILAMGATATQALTGNGDGILARQGTIETGISGHSVLITSHPSYLLRRPDAQAQANFQRDLKAAASHIARASL
ncbi:UdgX family uracil-DNA binding protein [Yoonia sp. MH D7]